MTRLLCSRRKARDRSLSVTGRHSGADAARDGRVELRHPVAAADPRQMEGPVEPALSLSNVPRPHSDWLSLWPVRAVLANGRKVRAKSGLLNRLCNHARRIVSGLRSNRQQLATRFLRRENGWIGE